MIDCSKFIADPDHPGYCARCHRHQWDHTRRWPRCRFCGEPLLTSNFELGYCNLECREMYHHGRNNV